MKTVIAAILLGTFVVSASPAWARPRILKKISSVHKTSKRIVRVSGRKGYYDPNLFKDPALPFTLRDPDLYQFPGGHRDVVRPVWMGGRVY